MKIVEFESGYGLTLIARLVRQGEGYGKNWALKADHPMIEFYDPRYEKTTQEFDLYGQFISRYNLETIKSIPQGQGLNLDGNNPEWSIHAIPLQYVLFTLGI